MTENPIGATANPPPPPAETIEEAVQRLTEEARTARIAKDDAENGFTRTDRRLTAVLNLQRDVEKAKTAYTAAYEQLKRDQQSYKDFLGSETETLEDRLGTVKADVDGKVDALRKTIEGLRDAAGRKREALAAAVIKRDAAKDDVKKQTDVVAGYKQLAGTVAARHAQLKAMRDEAIKIRQAGQYAVAYWLLQHRSYEATLDGKPPIVKPDELPDVLLAEVGTLADRENALAAAELEVVRCGQELGDAEKALAASEAGGEADLRKELEKLQAPDEVNRGAVNA